MAESKPFFPVKLVCGIIFAAEAILQEGENFLVESFGPMDLRSPVIDFDTTDYYNREMGRNLKRLFVSFTDLIGPEKLSDIKLLTNAAEGRIRHERRADHRLINLDPGYLTAAALVMATAKDFSHRIPLKDGVFAHLEFLFTKSGIQTLGWTYPDLRNSGYHNFFLTARQIYLKQLKARKCR